MQAVIQSLKASVGLTCYCTCYGKELVSKQLCQEHFDIIHNRGRETVAIFLMKSVREEDFVAYKLREREKAFATVCKIRD